MGLDFEYIQGQTPLDHDEVEGLLIPTIATQGELDEFEQQNIEQAIQWTMSRSFKADLVFSEEFIQGSIPKCLEMYGPGQENSEKPIKTWVWIGGKYHMS
jgi:hypothetical protein